MMRLTESHHNPYLCLRMISGQTLRACPEEISLFQTMLWRIASGLATRPAREHNHMLV
jgi:hypothetical protein